MDFTVSIPASQGHEEVFVVVDVFTNMIIFVPLKRLPLTPQVIHLFFAAYILLPWVASGQSEGPSSVPAGGNFWVC